MPPPENESEKIDRLRRAMYSRTLADKLKDKPRHEMEQGRPLVGEDFVHKDEGVAASVVAPRTIGLARVALWWILGAAIVFFAAALIFFGYYFFLGAGSTNTSSSNINISVSGPPQIQGGAPTEFQISVANRNNVPLELAELVVTYPNGTRMVGPQASQDGCSSTDADPTTGTLHSQRICLGTIESGGVRQGTITVIPAGGAGETAVLKVELEYHLAGSSAIFVASSDYNILFSSSPISIAVEGNSETIAGQPIELTVNVASNAETLVRDVVFKAQYPFGFKFVSAVPTPSAGGLWTLGDIFPGQKKTVVIRGTLSGAQSDERIFHFSAGTRGNIASSSVDTLLADTSFTMAISRPFLGLSIAVNGASSTVVTISPGTMVTVSVAYQNNLPTPITNAAIVARLSGIPIDGTTVRSSNGFYRSSDGVVLWDKSTAPELANLAAGARGTLSFSFQMPSGADLQSIVNPKFNISINAAGNRVSESGVPENLQAAVQQKVALASELQLVAEGLYYSNPFGSTGPLPPKAETETTYAIIFNVTNTTNRITNARVTASLPSYVRWVGIYSPNTEKVTFDQVQGTMTWDIGTIEPGVGLNGSTPKQAAIAIGFSPSTSQIGQQPVLLRDIILTGTDSATNQTVTQKTKTDVTTNLLQPAQTSGTGSVGTDPGFPVTSATVVK